MTIDATILIAVLSLLIGIAAGFVMHRSDYCVTGMFRDAVMFGDTFMLRSLCLQIVATMLLFEVLRRVGLLPLYPFPLLDKPSLATLAGGFLFGIGMVLAGGCVVGTLYKLGAGSVTSLAALFGLILGSGLYAEIHLQWSGFAKATTLSETLTIPQMLRLDPAVLIIAVALPAALLFHRWRRRHAWERETVASGYLQPWKAGLILAVLGAISYVNVAMPLGISTTYAKLAAMLATLVVPAHVESLAFFKAEPLHAFHATTGLLLSGGPGPHPDSIWAIQMPLIVGIVGGSTLSATILGEFAIRFKVPAIQLLTALTGGTLMGLASRMAPGCNVWHLMGGLPIFAWQSILFTIGLLPGTWIGGKILFRLLTNTNPLFSCRRCR